MKGKMKKLVALALATIMVLAMGITASAQDLTCGNGSATITIKNASKGETYTVYKLFDAVVTGTEGGSIIYKGTIPDELTDYFEKDGAGNIQAKAGAANEDGTASADLQTALSTWTEKAETAPVVDPVESDGSTLVFSGLAYGYYVVTTSQGDSALTVDSTNPNASIVDKNSTVPTVPSDGKVVDETNVEIGQTVNYTLKFIASNYDGEGEAAKKIVSYTVNDTLPSWLTNVQVNSITIYKGESITTEPSNVEKTLTGNEVQFNDKKIVIPWVDETTEKKSLYKNGSTVEIKYSAVVGSEGIAIDGEGNTNKFTLSYTTEDNKEHNPDPEGTERTDTETIFTYALAIKKVDQEGKALPGATFSIQGLQTIGSNGEYFVKGRTDTSVEGAKDTVMSTNDDGILIIKGVKADEVYKLVEESAPKRYNKLDGPVDVKATKMSRTTTSYKEYLTPTGEVITTETEVEVVYENDTISASVFPVVNMSGTVLPSTGGIGTTIFYVVGIILVAGAGILLITKKRMKKEQ